MKHGVHFKLLRDSNYPNPMYKLEIQTQTETLLDSFQLSNRFMLSATAVTAAIFFSDKFTSTPFGRGTRPWILLGGLQARVRDLFSPATAFGLQYQRRGSCHTPVFTWRPSIPGRRSSSVERATGQCHLRTFFVLIPATPEDISFPATTASITNYCVVVLKCLALSTTLIHGELNW